MPFLFHVFHIEMRVGSCWPWKSLRIIFFLWRSSNEEFMSEVMRQCQTGLNQTVLVFCSMPWFCWCHSQNTCLHLPWIFAILIYKTFPWGTLTKWAAKPNPSSVEERIINSNSCSLCFFKDRKWHTNMNLFDSSICSN